MSKDSLVMVGTQKGAFFCWSDVARREWRIDGPHLKGWDVTCLEVDHRGAHPVIYAGVSHFIYGAVIHRSDDLGKTWQQLDDGPAYEAASDRKLNRVWTVKPGPADQPDTLYAGVDEAGVFRSEDGGGTWLGLEGLNSHPSRPGWGPGAGGMCCHTVLQHPENHQRLWVGISAVGVLRSDDGGSSWHLKTDGLPIIEPNEEHPGVGSCVHSMVLDSSNPDRLFQQNHQGVFVSEDAGDHWRRIETGLPSRFGFPMVMHPREPDVLYVMPQESDEFRMSIDGQLAVYRSDDAGGSWREIRAGLPARTFQGVLRGAMANDTLDPCGLYFGTTGGAVYASADEGESWQALPCQLPRISCVTAVTIA